MLLDPPRFQFFAYSFGEFHIMRHPLVLVRCQGQLHAACERGKYKAVHSFLFKTTHTTTIVIWLFVEHIEYVADVYILKFVFQLHDRQTVTRDTHIPDPPASVAQTAGGQRAHRPTSECPTAEHCCPANPKSMFLTPLKIISKKIELEHIQYASVCVKQNFFSIALRSAR